MKPRWAMTLCSAFKHRPSSYTIVFGTSPSGASAPANLERVMQRAFASVRVHQCREDPELRLGIFPGDGHVAKLPRPLRSTTEPEESEAFFNPPQASAMEPGRRVAARGARGRWRRPGARPPPRRAP